MAFQHGLKHKDFIKMNIEIRYAQRQDLSAIHDLFVSPHVIQGTMRLPHHSLEYVEKRIEPSDSTIKLVACVENEVIGYGELVTHPDAPRHRHAADINIIAVSSSWLGKGIGGAILRSMLDLADHWMQVNRIGLIVWSSNESAISLYQKHGFELEGTLRQFVFKEGKYEDALLMARIRP